MATRDAEVQSLAKTPKFMLTPERKFRYQSGSCLEGGREGSHPLRSSEATSPVPIPVSGGISRQGKDKYSVASMIGGRSR